MTRLGILSVPPSIGEITRLALDAENAGFDSVWTGEYYYFSRNAFTTLTAMAMATRRIAVGSGIAYAFLRSPVQLATAAADIDEVSQGRMNPGLGAGTRAQNENWYGVPFASPGPRLEEVVAIARSLWSHRGGDFKHTGRFYNLSILTAPRRDATPPRGFSSITYDLEMTENPRGTWHFCSRSALCG